MRETFKSSFADFDEGNYFHEEKKEPQKRIHVEEINNHK